ncbi:hypothetical protein BDD12DRAFT_808880 [Trichophaea hybrida]|nr:hypothetical protein BDD12DRAFT_808880 [Trichophaea hybrida]
MLPDFLFCRTPSGDDIFLEAYHIITLRCLPDYPLLYRVWLARHIQSLLNRILQRESSITTIAEVLRNAYNRLRSGPDRLTSGPVPLLPRLDSLLPFSLPSAAPATPRRWSAQDPFYRLAVVSLANAVELTNYSLSDNDKLFIRYIANAIDSEESHQLGLLDHVYRRLLLGLFLHLENKEYPRESNLTGVHDLRLLLVLFGAIVKLSGQSRTQFITAFQSNSAHASLPLAATRDFMVSRLERCIDNQRNAEVPDLETICSIRPAVIRLCAWEIAQSTLEYYQSNLDSVSPGSPVQLHSSPRFGTRPTIYIVVDSQNYQPQNTASGQGTNIENRQQAVIVQRPTHSDENRPIIEHRATHTHRSSPLEAVREYRQYRGNLRELLTVETPVVTRRSSSSNPDNSRSYIGFPAVRLPAHMPADNEVTIRVQPTNYDPAFHHAMDIVEAVSIPHQTPTLADITEFRLEASATSHQQNTRIDSGEVLNGNDDTYQGISITQPLPTESRPSTSGGSYRRLVNEDQQLQSVENQQQFTADITAVGPAMQDEITRQIQEEGEIDVNFWRMESDINIGQVYTWVREAARDAAVPMGGALFHAVASRLLRQLSPDEVGQYLNSLPSGSLPRNEANDIGSYLSSFPPATFTRSTWLQLVHAAAEDSVFPIQVIEQTDNGRHGEVRNGERETDDRSGIGIDVMERDAEGEQLFMSERYLQLLSPIQVTRPSAQAAMVAAPVDNSEGAEETDIDDDDDETVSGSKYFSVKDWFQGHPSDIQIRESRAKAILEAYNDYFPRQPIIRNITTKIYDNVEDVLLYIRIEFHCDDVSKVKNGETDDSTRAMEITWQLAREMAMSEDLPSPEAQIGEGFTDLVGQTPVVACGAVTPWVHGIMKHV